MLALRKYGMQIVKCLGAMNFAVQFVGTPNPLCLKFLPGHEVMGTKGTKEYRNLAEASESSLAKTLLSIEGVQKLMYGNDFISVTKKDFADWEALKPKIVTAIDTHFSTKKPESESSATESIATKTEPKIAELEAVAMIRELIEFRIRPMLNDDGGDVQFRGFDPKTGVFLARKIMNRLFM